MISRRVILASSNVVRLLVARRIPDGQERTYRSWMSKFRKHVHACNKERGRVAPAPRSAWIEWNYDAELYAFGKRLGEDFDPKLLRIALTNKSYFDAEGQRRRDMGISPEKEDVHADHNSDLVKSGRSFVSAFLLTHLRTEFPSLPEEGIKSLNRFLMSDETLAHVGFHLGLKDLIMCEEYPPSESTLADTFLAVVDALSEDADKEKFVRDFLVTQLCGKNIFEIWNPADPKMLVTEILRVSGKSLPEARLIRQSGSGTLEACYNVGVYCDCAFLGYGSGETVPIAENSAFVDVLTRMFRIESSRAPVQFPVERVEYPIGVQASISG